VNSVQERTIAFSPPGASRYAYEAPRLTAYGQLTTLTRGGSGNANENNCAGCNPDVTKRKP
jgi:hypothetical protein